MNSEENSRNSTRLHSSFFFIQVVTFFSNLIEAS